jgi:hypothetical protein
MPEHTPIGGTHVRDFDDLRQQRPLSDLRADHLGHVRFACSLCPRTGEIRLADLRARFPAQAGLVNVLNAVRPADCPHAERDASGTLRCGFHYRDLDRRAGPAPA